MHVENYLRERTKSEFKRFVVCFLHVCACARVYHFCVHACARVCVRVSLLVLLSVAYTWQGGKAEDITLCVRMSQDGGLLPAFSRIYLRLRWCDRQIAEIAAWRSPPIDHVVCSSNGYCTSKVTTLCFFVTRLDGHITVKCIQNHTVMLFGTQLDAKSSRSFRRNRLCREEIDSRFSF